MAVRRPIVLVSGALSELPLGDSIVTTASGGTLTAGSGLVGGGNTTQTIRLDVALASSASGLIFAGTNHNDLDSCNMEERIFIITLLKTYRRLFNCLMFYS